MKKTIYSLAVVLFISLIMISCQADVNNPELQDSDEISLSKKGAQACVVIKDGIIEYSAGHYLAGQPLVLGYDMFGYNYQAHMFNGSYANAYLGRDGFPPYEGDADAYLAANPTAVDHWTWEYRDVRIMMKWSDEWLANSDCNNDGKLDRGYSCDPVNASSSGCPGAWLTNHEEDYGFTKIVAAPSDAYVDAGIWYTADDGVIGPVIWGAFAIIQEVGDGGLLSKSPDHAGFGGW